MRIYSFSNSTFVKKIFRHINLVFFIRIYTREENGYQIRKVLVGWLERNIAWLLRTASSDIISKSLWCTLINIDKKSLQTICIQASETKSRIHNAWSTSTWIKSKISCILHSRDYFISIQELPHKPYANP